MIMNFKDSYKSAVDEIHGDKALLHMILNGETKRKKSVFFSDRFIICGQYIFFAPKSAHKHYQC